MNHMFANQSKENTIYLLTIREIAEAQKHDIDFSTMTDRYGYTTQLIENTKVLCKHGKMVFSKSLQHYAVAWFHHYLQHPETTCLKETLHQ